VVQHGLATNAQLAGLGIMAPAVTHRVRVGELERVFPRVYRSPLVPPSVLQRALAAVLWAGEGSVASHGTAAALWKVDARTADAGVELWVPGERAPRNPAVVVHRGAVTGNDRRMIDRVPVTSPARMIVDIAAVLDGEPLEAALEDVLHRGLTTPATIERRLASLGGSGRAGAGRLRRLLAQRDQAPAESRLEVKVWRLLRGAGLRPVRQYAVRCESRTFRLDFAWPNLKVAVEAEGFVAHGGRLAHVADRRRLAALVAAGWSIVPVTWDDCTTDPEVFVERVRAALLRAA
jgi:very-short-patch-repair endonuclease